MLALDAWDNCTSRSDVLTVRVQCNAKPVAVTGGDLVVERGVGNSLRTVHLNGSGSYDADDEHLLFAWEVIEVPTSELTSTGLSSEPTVEELTSSFVVSGVNSSEAVLAPSGSGVYRIRLTVSDFCSSSSTEVTVLVRCNSPPHAAAAQIHQVVVFNESYRFVGSPESVPSTFPGSAFAPVVLDGSYSYDPDGLNDITSYDWQLIREEQPSLGASITYGPSGSVSVAPSYTTSIAGSPGASLLTVPAAIINAGAGLSNGLPVATLYTYRLTVSDGCSSSSVDVNVEAQCPSSPGSNATVKPSIIEWNERAGSRFSTPGTVVGDMADPEGELELVLCTQSNPANVSSACFARLNLTGEIMFVDSVDGVDARWQATSAPAGTAIRAALDGGELGAGISDRNAADTSLTIEATNLTYSTPFDGDGLGISMAGQYVSSYLVSSSCVASSDAATAVLQCNDPPLANAGSNITVELDQTGNFPVVKLDGRLSHPSADYNAAEAERDAPTFRFEWSLVHEPTGDLTTNAPLVIGTDSPAPELTGEETTGGIHEVFVTSV